MSADDAVPALRSYPELFRVFGQIGVLSFGGPAAQIVLMHRVLVDEKQWLHEDEFLRALSFCMLLPGPEAMQLATYAGWRLRGITGGLIAGGLFVLPGAALVLVLAIAYAAWGSLPLAAGLFLGIKAAVVVIVLQALRKIGARALRGRADLVIAGCAFLAIAVLKAPFPVIIALAGLAGALGTPATSTPERLQAGTIRWRVPIVWLALWLVPLAILRGYGPTVLADVALFFSKLAVVTFGGAYAVLAYMSQTAVETHGWLSTGQMLDALGLAETTPGPLILVTEFVGYLAGHGAGGVRMGLAAAVITLWMTFVPCFLWIFSFAPVLENLTHRPRLSRSLAAITSAVVGVILNLTLWFASHVFFAESREITAGPFRFDLPVVASFDPLALALAVLAAVLLFWRGWSIVLTLAVCATASALTTVL